MGPYEGHHVRITRPFYFGAYEVTRGQFARFVAASGYDTVAEKSRGGLRLDNSAQTQQVGAAKEIHVARAGGSRRRMIIPSRRSPGTMRWRSATG
jgi:formylglycine-generating enzyme required for sulfatase activity